MELSRTRWRCPSLSCCCGQPDLGGTEPRREQRPVGRRQCAGSSSGWARERLGEGEDRGKSPTDTGVEGLGSAEKRCPGWRQI